MADFDPQAYIAKAAPPSAVGGFDPVQYLQANGVQQPDPEQPGMTESALRGLAQGGTLGFADEIAGAGGAGIDALQKGSLSDVVADYIANRDKWRAADAAAQRANPKTFLAGQIGGGLATAAIPGLNIGAAETLAGRALGAGALGAVAGLGGSNADLTKGDVGGAARDAAIGGATGAVLQPAIEKVIAPAAGYLGEKAQDFAGWAGKKAMNAAFDTPEEVTSRYLSNPDAVNNALSREEFGQKLANTLSEIRGDTGAANEAAMSTLETDRLPIPGLEAKTAIDTLRSFKSEYAQGLADKLENELADRVGDGLTMPEVNHQFLTEREAHDVKRMLQGLGDYKSNLPSFESSRANTAAADYNAILKGGNTDYATAMSDLQQNIQSKQALANKFGLTRDFNQESGYAPTDRTLSAMNDIVRANKIDRAKVLDQLQQQGYGDLKGELKDTLAKGYFEGAGRTNGSRRVNAFAAIGGAAGHFTGIPGGGWTGAAVGAGLGKLADKYAPQAAKATLDATIIAQKLAQSPGAQRFIGAIQDAASRGQGALATTHFILSQTQPEYQQATQGE